MKIVCIGDSLTYGYGVSRLKNWISLSKNKLGADLINEGINGDTTGGMVGRFYESVISKKPDVVFIMGGTNDLIAGADLGTVQANIMAMSHQAYGNLITPVIGIPPKIDLEYVREDWAHFTDFNKIAQKNVRFKEWIQYFSKTFNIKYIDFYSEMEKIEISLFHKLYLDGLHLNEMGQKIMADIFCDKISKLI